MLQRNRVLNKKRKRLKKFTRYFNVCVIKTSTLLKYTLAKKNVCFIKKHVYKLLKLNNIIEIFCVT